MSPDDLAYIESDSDLSSDEKSDENQLDELIDSEFEPMDDLESIDTDSESCGSDFEPDYMKSNESEEELYDQESEETEFKSFEHEPEETEFKSHEPKSEETEFKSHEPKSEETEFKSHEPESEETEFKSHEPESEETEFKSHEQESEETEFKSHETEPTSSKPTLNLTKKFTLNLTPNLDKLKKELIKGLTSLDKSSINQGKKVKKFRKPVDYYRDLVFNGTFDDLRKVEISLELVNHKMSPDKMDIWNFYRYHVSRMKPSVTVGLQMYFLVKDNYSNKYLGIICLGSDIYSLKDRDDKIGWNNETKKKSLRYLLNIKACIPLQPIGFNFTAGKLLTMLAFSREVSQLFVQKIKAKNKPEYPILAICTTSLYGKSIQYDRLDCLNFIGKTSGNSTLHIPDELMDKCKQLCKAQKVQFRENPHGKNRLSMIKTTLPFLGLTPEQVTVQDYKRGIYLGYLYPNSRELMNKPELTEAEIMSSIDINSLPTISEIFQTWLNKYAIRRYEWLKSHKRLKKKVNFNISKREKNTTSKSEHRERKIVKLANEVIKSDPTLADKKLKDNQIRDIGLKILQKQECVDRKNCPGYSKKKTFEDKYDFNKLRTWQFNKRNEHLKKFIEPMIQLVIENPAISTQEIRQTLNISCDSIKTILNHGKK